MKLFCLVLLGLASLIKAECPASDDLPVRWPYDESKFFCARYYPGPGSDAPFNGCNGCTLGDQYEEYVDVFDGQDIDAGECCFYPMGSLVVRPGCTFYQFTEYNSVAVVFEGGAHPNIANGHSNDASDCGRGVRQMKCRCNMANVNCVPEDSYEVVMQCDATLAQADSECNYQKTIGTSFSESLSTSMSVDYTVSAKLKVEFFEFFSESVGVSASTGYDWTSVSSETVSEEDTISITATATAGYVARIEQAVGHCGASTAKTELFRVSHVNKQGDIVQQSYHKMFNNGTTIDLPSDFMSNLPNQKTTIQKVSKKSNVNKKPVGFLAPIKY